MEHWQFTSRSGTVNLKQESEEDFKLINEKLKSFQQKFDLKFDSFKDLFLFMLDESMKSPEIKEVIKEEQVKPEQQDFSIHITDNLNEMGQISQRLLNLHKLHHGENQTFTMGDCVKLALEIAELPPETAETIEKEIEVIREIPMEIGENQYLITLTDEGKKTISKKKSLLTVIAQKRFTKGKSPSLESPETLIEQLAFSGGALLNSEGDFYTGV